MLTILFGDYKKKIKNHRKKGVFLFLLGSLFIFGGVYVYFQKEKEQCDAFVRFDEIVLCVEIADTEQEKARGLSFRKDLEKNTGMLFIFDEGTSPYMWMKDMEFALDFIWMNSGGVVVDIDENITPNTYPQTVSAPVATPFVLEVSAGVVKEYGIEKNMKMIFLEEE